MPAIRKCAKCGKPNLISKMGIFKAVRPYECSNCGEIVNISPVAMLGMQLSVLVSFSIAGLVWIIFLAKQQTSLAVLIFSFMFWLFLSSISILVIISKIRKHYQNPIVKLDESNLPDSWIEGKSLLFGLLVPILFIATIIGFIILLYYIDKWL